jgi:hypothetical protein
MRIVLVLVALMAMCPAASATDLMLRPGNAEHQALTHPRTNIPESPEVLFRQFLHWLGHRPLGST